MVVIKSGGQVIGGKLTAAEKKAMNIEINRALAERMKQNEIAVDAMILWAMHEEFGFGEKRLKRFYDNFIPRYKALMEFYGIHPGDKSFGAEETDTEWLHVRKLKEIGVDLESWHKESKDSI